MPKKINIDEKFSLFSEHFRPKIVAELNGQEFKLVKAEGAYPWHSHADADEMFLYLEGGANPRISYTFCETLCW